jgi:hypothetical protein
LYQEKIGVEVKLFWQSWAKNHPNGLGFEPFSISEVGCVLARTRFCVKIQTGVQARTLLHSATETNYPNFDQSIGNSTT